MSEAVDEAEDPAMEDVEWVVVAVEPSKKVEVPAFRLVVKGVLLSQSFNEMQRGLRRYFLGLQLFTLGFVAWCIFFGFNLPGNAAKLPFDPRMLMLGGGLVLVVGWVMILWSASDIHQMVLLERFPLLTWPLIISEVGVVVCHALASLLKVAAAQQVRLVLILVGGVFMALLLGKLTRPLGRHWRWASWISASAALFALVTIVVWTARIGAPLQGQQGNRIVAWLMLAAGPLYWICQSLLSWRLSRAFNSSLFREQLIAGYFIENQYIRTLHSHSVPTAELTTLNVDAVEDRRHRAKRLEDY